MESFWEAAVYPWLATMGAFVAFVVFYWWAAQATQRHRGKRRHERLHREQPRLDTCTTDEA
jgi:hypothetical protein